MDIRFGLQYKLFAMRPLITLAILLVGCDGRAPITPGPHPEAGVLEFDAAMIGFDAGARARDGGPHDGGARDGGRVELDSGPPDAGPPLVCSHPSPGGDCVLRVPVGSFGPLTAACLPRCSAATAAAYRACGTQACRNTAVRADTTPGTTYYIGSARVSTPMDCEACISYQEFHCFSLVCQSEVDTYVDHCIAGVNPSLCDASIAAIDNCLAALSPSEEATVGACMDSASGPAGCFACE